MRTTLELAIVLLLSCSLAYTARAITYTFIQEPAVNVAGGSLWINATLWTGGLIPTNDSANDDVFINATLLRNKVLTLPDVNLKIRTLTLLCPDAANGEFQPFQLILRRINVSVVNITTSGWCALSWESQAGKVFNVSDSWVSGSMLSSFSGLGTLTIGRYFNSTRFGTGGFTSVTAIIPYPQNRHLRSRVGISQFGLRFASNAQIEWHSVEFYQSGVGGYIELVAGSVSFAGVSITSSMTLSSGETGNCTLTLANFTSVGNLLQKAATTDSSSITSTVILNDDVQFTTTNRFFYIHRGQTRLFVNGRARFASMALGFMESPTRNSSLSTQIRIGAGALLETQSLAASGSGISKQFGYNTQFFINGTLKLGSGSALTAASQMYANTTEPWGTISFGCTDRDGEIVTDPIVFGTNTIVGGCKLRTVGASVQQNFPVVTFGAGSTLVLDGSNFIPPTIFYTNTTLEATASIYATVVPLPTVRPSISCLPPCKQFYVASTAVTVEPLSAIQFNESVPIISAVGASDVTLTAGAIQPSGLVPVQNGTHLSLFRPVPPPVEPPVDPPVAPPMAPPVNPPVSPPTSSFNPSSNPVGTSPSPSAVTASLSLVVGAVLILIL